MEQILNQLPDYAKDTKINLQNLFNQSNQLLNDQQIYGCLLACALTIKNPRLLTYVNQLIANQLDQTQIYATKIASTMMAMNNIYYRFTHLVKDSEYSQMQAGLRMRTLLDHKISQVDFEIYCLAISIINGCGMCIDAHVEQLLKNNLNKSQIQMIAKIASIINSLNQVLEIENK